MTNYLAPLEKMKLPAKYEKNVQKIIECLKPREDFGDIKFDYRPPAIRIKQKSTSSAPEMAKNGDLYSPDLGEIIERPLRVVFLLPFYTRVKFTDSGIGCRSNDGKTSIYGDTCETCADKEKCKFQLNILASNPEFSKLYHLMFSSTSFGAGQKALRQIRNSQDVLWQRIHEINTQEASSAKGNYYVFKVEYTQEKIPDEALEIGKALHDVLSESRKTALESANKLQKESAEAVEALENEDIDNSQDPDFTDL